MKTKLFTLFLVLITSIGIINASVTINGIAYNLNDSSLTAEVTSGSVYSSGVVTIPSSIIYNDATYSVTSIGDQAFYYCSGLTSVTIPNSVTNIGQYAFSSCTSLTSVTIPNSVTSIEDRAFSNCSSLTNIEIPNSVTSIGYYAFSGCSGLTSPVYNTNCFAFLPTSYSGAYTIPDGIKQVTSGAFADCTKLTSIIIPNSVISIESEAFVYCTSLTSITIPNSITSIGRSAFSGCSGLTSPVYNTHVFAYLPTSYSGAYTIPDGIESIAGDAFASCSGLTSVTIPNSVTSIGEYAFCGCTSLTSIEIPNNVTSIKWCTFSGCVGLTSVMIGSEVTSISDYTFYNCSGLTSVICLAQIPPTLEGDEVFGNCNDLSFIYVPCNTIDAYEQSWSTYANIIKYHPLEYSIEGKVNMIEAGHVDIPSTICEGNIITAVPERAYRFVRWADGNTDNPRTIELTQDTTMEAIFDYLLEGKCGKDSVLVWKLDTTTMALEITGKGALSENYTYGTFIESLTIGNEVTSIGQSAFYGCNNLKNTILGSSVKVLEEFAFCDCPAIETITCYSQRPPTVNNYALYGLDYSTIVYVPADYLNTYKMHDAWGLYDVRPLGATSAETDDIKITPSETTAEVVWPAVSGAATYELVIKDKAGNIICTLVFNANGQLTTIAFNAPARNNAPQQTQSTGFSFTVTGLEKGTIYDLTMTAKDSNGTTLDSNTIAFTTAGGEQAIDPIDSSSLQGGDRGRLILRDGQILILRGDRTYTITGQEVK